MRFGFVPAVFSIAIAWSGCAGIVVDDSVVDDPEVPVFPDGQPVSACKRVDLVFAIDASFTMREELAALSEDVFPAFAPALRNVGNGLEDYRVGVLDACAKQANFHTRGAEVDDCAFESGEVWMDSNSSRLTDEFSCVADVYTDDFNTPGNDCTGQEDDEQGVSTAIAALSGEFIEGPNQGFLRDDALLVVVAITDEDEHVRPDRNKTADELFNELVAVKGDIDKMVLLTIAGAEECTGAYGDAKEARKLKQLTDMFVAEERGVFWDLCGGRLEDGLSQAMSVIEGTCLDVN